MMTIIKVKSGHSTKHMMTVIIMMIPIVVALEIVIAVNDVHQ